MWKIATISVLFLIVVFYSSSIRGAEIPEEKIKELLEGIQKQQQEQQNSQKQVLLEENESESNVSLARCPYCGTSANPCSPNPCHNGGYCTPTGTGDFICTCTSCFTGELCEITDPCKSCPCHNGGACMPTGAGCGVVCICKPCYTGTYCEHMINTCSNNPCHNGGNCLRLRETCSYQCTCPCTYTGPNCETPTTFCKPDSCGSMI